MQRKREQRGRQSQSDDPLIFEQTIEHADRIDDLCERMDKIQIEVGILKWTNRIMIVILVALGGAIWELIKTILKYAPAIIKALESLLKK